MQNYELLIERISKLSGVEKQELERRVEAKRAKLSGLISREGAAQIIASELGINFDDQELKISELVDGVRKVNVTGKILNLFPVREFSKNGRSGKVVNLVLADDSGNIRVVLWDTRHISMIEDGRLKQEDVVEIKNGSIRNMEIHLSGFSELKKSNAVIENVRTEDVVSERKIEEALQGQKIKVRGLVVQMFNPRFFNVCPECGKKAIESAEGFSCNEHGKILPKERALINFVLDDGTEAIRAVLFSEQIEKLIPEEDLKDIAKLSTFKEDLLGSEVFVSGNVKKNALFNNLEISVSDIERVDADKLVDVLEKG